jgi:hypothetical protein
VKESKAAEAAPAQEDSFEDELAVLAALECNPPFLQLTGVYGRSFHLESKPMNYLFVDGNGLGYYHHESDKLSNGDMEVQAIFGFLKNVRRYASILRARPVILWDGFSDKRREFYPEYKPIAMKTRK